MPPRIVHISEADANAAKYEISYHSEPIVQKRMQCLRLKYRGYQNQEIADVLEISRNTVCNYLSLYEQSGLEGLKWPYINQWPLGNKVVSHFPPTNRF